jgi:short-subunit dehydrogenase
MSKWALITGASQGIGYEFSKLFAAQGNDLVLVARDTTRLEQVAEELRTRHGVKVRVLAGDLGAAAATQEIFDELQREQIFISFLVNNAGFGFQGAFSELDLQGHRYLMHVNMTALVELTHLFLKPMLQRREGRILNVASTASFQPGPFMNLYYASKAFVYSFSCALSEELKGTGVTATVLCPGLTKSQFHTRAGLKRPTNHFLMMPADKVAKIGYRAMMRGKPVVVAGWFNKTAAVIAKALPGPLMSKVTGAVNRGDGAD